MVSDCPVKFSLAEALLKTKFEVLGMMLQPVMPDALVCGRRKLLSEAYSWRRGVGQRWSRRQTILASRGGWPIGVALQSILILLVMAQGVGSTPGDLAVELSRPGVRQMSFSPVYLRHVEGGG